jgi:hypothetical protein
LFLKKGLNKMKFNFKGQNPSTNKTAFRTLITRKQQLFKRLKSRYCKTGDPSERRFLKAEAGRVIGDLRTCASQWKKNMFGGNNWVTNGYSIGQFSGGTGRGGKTHSRKTRSSRTRNGRRTSPSTRGNRSTRKYRAYAAW